MNRSTFILGFALLVIAATLAASITMRNAPVDSGKTTRHEPGTPRTAQPHALAQPGSTAGSPADSKIPATPAARHITRRFHQGGFFMCGAPRTMAHRLASHQQVEWRTRTAAVERAARKKLERLTDDLALNAAQIDKMFPLIVRSTPGYDPVMLSGGTAATSPPKPRSPPRRKSTRSSTPNNRRSSKTRRSTDNCGGRTHSPASRLI